MLKDLYFKTTCNIRAHFLGPMGGLNIEGPLYSVMVLLVLHFWNVIPRLFYLSSMNDEI